MRYFQKTSTQYDENMIFRTVPPLQLRTSSFMQIKQLQGKLELAIATAKLSDGDRYKGYWLVFIVNDQMWLRVLFSIFEQNLTLILIFNIRFFFKQFEEHSWVKSLDHVVDHKCVMQ